MKIQNKSGFVKNVLLNIVLLLAGIGIGGLIFSSASGNAEQNVDSTTEDIVAQNTEMEDTTENIIPQSTDEENMPEITTSQSAEVENTSEIVIPQSIYDDLEELKELVDYAIERFCDEEHVENTYSYDVIENMMHHDTRINDSNGKYGHTFDLDRIVSPGLSYNKFTFEVQGQDEDDTIYVVINTYRMKMYVYDSFTAIIEGEFPERDISDSEEEDLVQSDWSDMWQEEYGQFARDGYEYLTIPENEYLLDPEFYGMVVYGLQRYCEENGIEEMFSFSYPEDRVARVKKGILTVKVESENRILYMDIDAVRNRMHIYEVQE